jgi:hypothetical protein
MNVKISYTTQFIAAVWWNGKLIMSNYDVTFKLITAGMDPANTNTALDRLKYMVEEYLIDAVFVNHADIDQIKKLKAAGIKVVVMPEEPVDQIIGMMLYSKISAVMEGHMLVRSVMLSSTAGDSVVYEHDNTESVAPFDQPGWWNSTDPHCEIQAKRNPEKVFVIAATNQWRDLGLEWIDNDNKHNEDGNVLVFTEFKKNEDK